MDKRKARRNLIIAGLTGIVLASYYNYDYPYNPYYEVLEDEEEFGRYSNGKVYIGDIDYIHNIKDNVDKNDILIVIGYQNDENELDPNARIISSHRITDRNQRNEILNLLLIYNKLYPSKWNRTLESMRVEWTVHNILYNIGYEKSRTVDVDLDNSEEELYNNKLLKRLIK